METKDKKEKQNKETQNRKNKNADPIPGSEERNRSNKGASSGTANRATPEQAAQQEEFESEAGEELNREDKESDQRTSRGTSESEQPTRQRGKSSTQPGTPRGSSEERDQNRGNETNRSAREQRSRASEQAEPLADYNYLNRRNWPEAGGQSERWRDKMIFESDQDYNEGISPHGMNTPLGMNTGRKRANANRFGEGEQTNLGYERRMREERRNQERRSQGQRSEEGRDYSDYRNTGRYEGPGADTGSSPYRGYDRDYGSRPTDFRSGRNNEYSQYGDDRNFTREESDFRNRSFGSGHTSDDERQPNYSDVKHGGYMSTSNRNNYDPGDDNSYGMSRAREYERFNSGSQGRGSEGDRDFGREQQNFGNRSGEYEDRGRYSERNRDRETGRTEDWNRQGNRERGWEQPENRERESYQGYGETSYSDKYDKDISRRGEDRENRRRGGMDRRGH